MELACPNCHMPLRAIVEHYATHGTVIHLDAASAEPSEAAIETILAWPRPQQDRLYRLLHAAGCRV